MDYDFIEELEILIEKEKFNDVIKKIESLDKEEIDNSTYIILAHAYGCIGNDEKTLEILSEISDDVEDDDIAYHFELGSCLYSLNRYDEAIAEAEKCLEIDGQFADAWLLLCYIYIETNDKENFDYVSKKAREIDPDSFEEFFGTAQNIFNFECYSKNDAERVASHIEKYFGNITDIFNCSDNDTVPIIVVAIPPTEEKNYYKLVTLGMGAYKANVPKELAEFKMNRIELVAYLPPDIDEERLADLWVVQYMRILGNMMLYEDSWLGFGHTVSNGEPFDSNTNLNGVILDFVRNVGGEAIECELSDGDIVTFYQFIPLYEEEMLYKIENGCDALFKLLYNDWKSNISKGIIDMNRANVCEDITEKKWAIPRSSIEKVLDWSGGDGCFATDRIMVECQKIGYMYREAPNNEYDSGWRFLAGDESPEYMNNTENMGIYSLNTLCNYDIEIINFLKSPVGSAFYRSKSGEFVEDKHFRKK